MTQQEQRSFHPDTPQWFVHWHLSFFLPFVRENAQAHAALGEKVAEMGEKVTEARAEMRVEVARLESRLLWRGLGGIALISSVVTAIIKFL